MSKPTVFGNKPKPKVSIATVWKVYSEENLAPFGLSQAQIDGMQQIFYAGIYLLLGACTSAELVRNHASIVTEGKRFFDEKGGK